MGERKKLRLSNWPFEKNKKAQLVWIGEPFKQNKKWMLDTYFNDGKNTKRVIQDWANIHFLSINKYYTDGDLLSGEIVDDDIGIKIQNISLGGITPKYNEAEWKILKSDYKSKSKTFSFWKNDILYTIPIVEIVRAVLAPNTFLLNNILYNDSLEDYFTYTIQDKRLRIDFNNEYKVSCLNYRYYRQLAWMISNREILKMYQDIGYNIFKKDILIFDFYMSDFNIMARTKKNKHGFTIVEILEVNSKKIKVDEMTVYHPSFEKKEKSNEAKLRSYKHFNNQDEDKIIDNSVDGAEKFDERINNDLIIHEYLKVPIIKKEKNECGKQRMLEDSNTEKYLIYDDNSRTLALEGGVEKANGIEISETDETLIPEELNYLIFSLKELEKLDWIEKVDIRIVNLPLGRKFSYLSDRLERRKCLIAEILRSDGKTYGVIEVQREDNLLSTLILKMSSNKMFELAYEKLLNSLIFESGNWSMEVINNLKGIGIEIYRNKHMKNMINNIIKKIKNGFNFIL